MWELFVVEGADGRMKVVPTPVAAPCEKSSSGFKAARFPQSFMKIKCWLQNQQVRNNFKNPFISNDMCFTRLNLEQFWTKSCTNAI